jgi:hypothetical protein
MGGEGGKMMSHVRGVIRFLTGIFIWAALCACASVGRDFPESPVAQIHIGITTQTQIRAMFGNPWRVGIEDGRVTWTYGKYLYRLIGQSSTKDLIVRFDPKNAVASYSFSSTADSADSQ